MTEITWHNCAEQMPPDDKVKVIIRHINGQFLDCYGSYAFLIASDNKTSDYDWTEFT